jgi:hypothetical protein
MTYAGYQRLGSHDCSASGRDLVGVLVDRRHLESSASPTARTLRDAQRLRQSLARPWTKAMCSRANMGPALPASEHSSRTPSRRNRRLVGGRRLRCRYARISACRISQITNAQFLVGIASATLDPSQPRGRRSEALCPKARRLATDQSADGSQAHCA